MNFVLREFYVQSPREDTILTYHRGEIMLRRNVIYGLTILIMAAAARPISTAQTPKPVVSAESLEWITYNDPRLQWLNVAAWEPRGDGMQPVRVPKDWRDKWPQTTARRALSAAGVTLRFRTDSKKIVFRATLIDTPDNAAAADEAWERARPPYFDLYRDGKFVRSIAGAIQPGRQDVVIYDQPDGTAHESDITLLLPFYYRNAEIIVNGIGIEKTAKLTATSGDQRPRVLFHGDSITHGHGVFTSRETYVWRACEQAGCIPLNLGFGGSAYGDNVVAQYIAGRNDWDVLVIAIGTNSFGGTYQEKPETAAQYGVKYDAFLATIREKYPMKPIIAMTPIFNRSDHFGNKNRNGEGPQDYRNAISKVVRARQAKDKNLFLIDGMTFFTDPVYLLPTDMVHPNNAGEEKMADGVVAVLKPLVTRLGKN
jgi:lysophospholipase L1-like esterase